VKSDIVCEVMLCQVLNSDVSRIWTLSETSAGT